MKSDLVPSETRSNEGAGLRRGEPDVHAERRAGRRGASDHREPSHQLTSSSKKLQQEEARRSMTTMTTCRLYWHGLISWRDEEASGEQDESWTMTSFLFCVAHLSADGPEPSRTRSSGSDVKLKLLIIYKVFKGHRDTRADCLILTVFVKRPKVIHQVKSVYSIYLFIFINLSKMYYL